MKESIFNTVLNRPVWVLLAALLFVIAASMGGEKLVFKNDYRVFFSEENPELATFEAMQQVYSKSDNVIFILSPKNGDVFTKENLTAIHWLTNEAWQIPYSSRVDSITNFQHTVAEQDDLIVEDLVLEPEGLTEQDLPRLRTIVNNEPLLANRLISPSGHVTLVSTTLQLIGSDPAGELNEIVTKTREIAEQLRTQYPSIEVRLSGLSVMNQSFAEVSEADLATLVPLMFLIVIGSMALLLRTFSGTLATVVIIFISITCAMGLAGWAGLFLTSPSASAPTIILTLAVADCVHVLSTFFYEMRQGQDKRQALKESLRVNFQPIFLTSITTAIGFLSLNLSDSPPFRDLGNMVATGVMLAFVFSITVLPALLMLLPVRVKPKQQQQKDLMDKLAMFVINNRKLLLPVMALLVVTSVFFVPKNELNDDFVQYFDTSVPFRNATDYMQENLSGMSTIEISVDSGEPSGINQPAFLQTLEDFSRWLRQQPETDHVNTLSDTVKRLNKNMHGDNQDYYAIPANQELSAQYLLLYELSLPYGLDLNNQLNVSKSSSRVIGTFKNLTSNEFIDLENRIKQWFSENATEYSVEIASPSLMFAHIGQRNIYSMLLGTTIALILISALLGLALKSFRYGVISLLPNLAPAAVGFGIWYFLHGQVGLALSVVVSMTLGIVVDDTVHFLSKYQHARNNLNKNSTDAVHYAFSSVGRALWITTLVLVAGFMVLAQSSFSPNSEMGLLTAITIFVALVIDFLLLAPLLIKLDEKKHEVNTDVKELA